MHSLTLPAEFVCPGGHTPLHQPHYHGDALLLQRRGVDDAPQQPTVPDGVLLPLEALVLQLTVHQQQLAAQ